MEPGSLEDRLSEFVERRERGEALTPEAFARLHPEIEAELLRALHTLASTEALLPTGPPDLPARIGPYRVLGEIGRGGMGRVLSVERDQRPGERIALKLLHVSLEHQPRSLERFRREGQALERITHPGIVRVLEAGLLDNRPFLAMEQVEGTSLAELLRAARERRGETNVPPLDALELPGEGTPLERAVRLVARTARALAAAHREGVLHRDLNPRNVLVRPGGEPVVIDFGLMRASGAPTLTGSGDLLGTPQYMSPEQARGERVDERSDVFGLGTILRELLTLAPPREPDETLALLRAASTRPLSSLRRAQGIPRELAIVTHRATAFFPRWRYPSIDALAADLERWLEGERIHARPAHVVERGLELCSAHRLAAGSTGALLLVLALGAFVWSSRHGDGRQEELVRRMNAVVMPWLDGDPERARVAHERLLEFEPDAPLDGFLASLVGEGARSGASDPATRALLQGERALRAGDASAALGSFYTASDLAPGYPFVQLLQGLAAFEAGDLEVARAKLEHMSFHFGPCSKLHRTLAALYERLGAHEDTCRALNAVLALAPEDSLAWLALARARLAAGRPEEALRAAERARALEPVQSRQELERLAAELEARGEALLAGRLRGGAGD